MSDFLATITARTTGTALGIRPRQPALFEPETSLDAQQQPVAPPHVEATPAEPSPAMDRAPVGQPLLTSEGAPQLPDPISEGVRASDTPIQPLATPDEPHRASPTVRPAARIDPTLLRASTPAPVERQRAPRVTPPPPAPLAQPRATLDIESPRGQRLERTQAEPRPELQPVMQATPASMPEPVSGDVTPAQPVEMAGVVAVARPERGETGYLTQSTTALRPAPVLDLHEQVLRRDDASQTLTVQVTIGRIEIRAAGRPASEVRRPAANPAILPLNEYLRRHKGGA